MTGHDEQRNEEHRARSIDVGSRVRVRNPDTEEEEYVIVRPADADAAHGRISADSPVGRSLLGRRRGEEVRVQTPGGLRGLLIVDVSAPRT